MWVYIRYGAILAIVVIAAMAMLLGGAWHWVGFALAFVVAVGLDGLLGDDTSEPQYAHPWILNLMLYSSLPFLVVISATYAWTLGRWTGADWLGFGAALQAVSGVDVLAMRARTSWLDQVGGGLGLALLYGGLGTVVAHELTHRTWDKLAMIVGRWLLAFTADASFAIEHVYGHHKNVSTRQDPATSRRGETVYAFVVRSTLHSYISAWRLETERLRKQGHSLWSWRNRMHRGNLMTLLVAAGFYAAAGWLGVAAFALIAIHGKFYLEFVNYVEHYGLVRVPGAPVEPRHSWNCNKRVSSVLLFNLTRHSHHHAMGEKPFWELKAYPDTPMMPHGYLTMLAIAAIPPLWNRIMIPKVLEWDRVYASPAERPLIEQANQLSGDSRFGASVPARTAAPAAA